MSEEVVNNETPFKKFTVQKARLCQRCKEFIHKGTQAWKPARSGGGWMMTVVLCSECVKP